MMTTTKYLIRSIFAVVFGIFCLSLSQVVPVAHGQEPPQDISQESLTDQPIEPVAELPVENLDDQYADTSPYLQAQVTEILETTYPIVLGREIEFQQLRVETENKDILDTVFNDYVPVSVGDTIYISPGYNPDIEQEGYYVVEVERVWPLLFVALLFVCMYLIIAGTQGFRSLIALGISIAGVWFVLLPMIATGYSPLMTSVVISAVILGVAIFITHKISIISVASYTGSLIAILVTIAFAEFAVTITRISGQVGDDAGTLAVLYNGSVDLQGLLLGAMIIGILGVLDDVAIMQVAMVREFMAQGKKTTREVFIQSLRVGREHASALVNTLVLAYVAVSLPLFLIVLAPQYSADYQIPFMMQISNELFVAEFIRSIVGSFGLVLTIPIVTVIAIVLYSRFPAHLERDSGHIHTHHH